MPFHADPPKCIAKNRACHPQKVHQVNVPMKGRHALLLQSVPFLCLQRLETGHRNIHIAVGSEPNGAYLSSLWDAFRFRVLLHIQAPFCHTGHFVQQCRLAHLA